jgi:hypothetical protein
MNAMNLLWFILGFAAGGAHVWMLWQASQPPFHGVTWHFPRLMLIGSVLFASAIGGGMPPAIAGWVISYFISVGIFAIRSPG